MATFHDRWKEATLKSSDRPRIEALSELVAALVADDHLKEPQKAAPLPLRKHEAAREDFEAQLGATPVVVKGQYTKMLLERLLALLTASQSDASPWTINVWKLLPALLRLAAYQSVGPPIAELLGAAISACRCKTSGDTAASESLPSAILAALQNLIGGFPIASRKHLDQSVELAEAAVVRARMSRVWGPLAEYSTELLTQQFASSSNQRKVFSAACSHLLVPVATLLAIGTERSGARLAATALEALDAAIFHPTHLQGHAELAVSEADNWAAVAFPLRGKARKKKLARHYQWQLLQVVGDKLASNDRLESEGVQRLVPWLLERFVAAARGGRGVAESPARTELGGAQAATEGSAAGGMHRSPEFAFFAVLLRPLLQLLAAQLLQQDETEPLAAGKRKRGPLQKGCRKQKQQKTPAGAASQQQHPQEALARSTAQLLQAMKRLEVYRPTEDAIGSHFALLRQAAELSVKLDSDDAAAAAELIGAIVDVEHRALEAQTPRLWPVILQAAGSGEASASEAAAGKFVAAFAELRQLETLLKSLLAALADGISQGSGRVLSSPAFMTALGQALRGLPSGQAAGIVDCAASFAAALCPTGGCLTANAALGHVCLALLKGLRVELPTARPIAAAVERLLQEPLSRLFDFQHSAFLRPPSDAELQHAALVLRVLAATLRLHAECRGFDPQIAPLRGQCVGDNADTRDTEGGADVRAGYFSAVGLPADTLLAWAQRLQVTGVEQECTENLKQARLALAHSAVQRMATVHECILRKHFCCPLILTDSSVPIEEDAGQQAEDMAKEMRALAGAVMRLLAASKEPYQACQLLWANAEVMLQWADSDTALAVVGQMMLPPPGERHRASVALQGLRGNGIPELGRPCIAALGWCSLSVLQRLIGGQKLAQDFVNTATVLGSPAGAASNRVCAALRECLDAQGSVGLPFREASEEALADLQRLGEALLELGCGVDGKAARGLLYVAVCVFGAVASLCPKDRTAAWVGEGKRRRYKMAAKKGAVAVPAGKAVAAMAGWLELIAQMAEKGDDILEVLASAGPEAVQALLILGSHWREGNGRSLQHVGRILSRHLSFLLGVRAPGKPSGRDGEHVGSGHAIQLLAMGSGPTAAGADLQQEVFLSAAARGVRTAWECLRGKARSGAPGGIMAGPALVRLHAIDARALKECTEALSKAAQAKLMVAKLLLGQQPAAGALETKLRAAAILSFAGHTLNACMLGSAGGQEPFGAAELAEVALPLLPVCLQSMPPLTADLHPLLADLLRAGLASLVQALKATQKSDGTEMSGHLFEELIEAHIRALQVDPEASDSHGLRAVLLGSLRDLVEAASLPQTRAVLDTTLGQMQGVTSLQGSLPLLQVLYEVLESSGSPAKQQLIGSSADRMASRIFAFLRQPPAAKASNPARVQASICAALKCLESMVARPALFPMSPMHTAACLEGGGASDLAAGRPLVLLGVCKLLVTTLRHRTSEARRCMALVAASCASLLQGLICASQSRIHEEEVVACAEGVAHVYTTIAEQKDALGAYCMHLLSDYIVLVAAPAESKSSDAGRSGQVIAASESPLPEGAYKKLRDGAYALFGACSAVQGQHVYIVLGKTSAGARGAAMSALKHDFEKHYKYTGKV